MKFFRYKLNLQNSLSCDRVGVFQEYLFLRDYTEKNGGSCSLKEPDVIVEMSALEYLLSAFSLYKFDENGLLDLTDLSDNCGHLYFSREDVLELIEDLYKLVDRFPPKSQHKMAIGEVFSKERTA